MLPIDMWGDPGGDAAEHDRLRAHRVVEYICHRFPNVRCDEASEEFDDEAGRRSLHEASKRKVSEDAVPAVAPTRRAG
jgi:hypothetical protein